MPAVTDLERSFAATRANPAVASLPLDDRRRTHRRAV